MKKLIRSYKVHQFILGIIMPLLLIGSAVFGMESKENTKNKSSMVLESSAFKDNESMPSQYTSDGKEVFPPLAWKGAPKDTRSFVLICEDPDGTGGTKDHVVLYDIPATLEHIDEGGKNLPPEARFGKNVRGTLTWAGPKPPAGTGIHHYIFTLYALDKVLKLEEGLAKTQAMKVIEGHILAQAKLTGLYQHKNTP